MFWRLITLVAAFLSRLLELLVYPIGWRLLYFLSLLFVGENFAVFLVDVRIAVADLLIGVFSANDTDENCFAINLPFSSSGDISGWVRFFGTSMSILSFFFFELFRELEPSRFSLLACARTFCFLGATFPSMRIEDCLLSMLTAFLSAGYWGTVASLVGTCFDFWLIMLLYLLILCCMKELYREEFYIRVRQIQSI